jgi:predicted kinase
LSIAILHLIHGFIGMGKTTFAKALADGRKCTRFNADEMMIGMYGQNPPANNYRERENKIKGVAWQLTQRLLKMGQEVVLDFGFWQRAERDQLRAWCKANQHELRLYNVTCPIEVAKQRTLERTKKMPEHALFIDEAAFDELLKKFEPINSNEEDSILVNTHYPN